MIFHPLQAWLSWWHHYLQMFCARLSIVLASELSQFGTCVKTLTRAWVGGWGPPIRGLRPEWVLFLIFFTNLFFLVTCVLRLRNIIGGQSYSIRCRRYVGQVRRSEVNGVKTEGWRNVLEVGGRSEVGRHDVGCYGGRLGFSFGCCALAAVIGCLRISGNGTNRVGDERRGWY